MFVGINSTAIAQTDDDDTEITVTDSNGKEEVIDLPEALTSEYDSLLNAYNAKTYLKANADCDLPDINPVYDKEVYKKRLSRIPTVIEMPYNDVVQKFIDRYSGRLRRSVSIGTQPQCRVKSGCNRALAVHARHRQTLWSGGELTRR